GLDRVTMAEIVRLLRQGEFGIAAIEGNRAICGGQQPCDQPQQGSLARSIGPGDRQQLAGCGLEIEPGKHLAATAHTPDATSREPHCAYSLALAKRWVARENWGCDRDMHTFAGGAARLERFYKPGTLMPHTFHACKRSSQTPTAGVSIPLSGT